MSAAAAFEPNTPILVTLAAVQWETILVQLAEGPYKIVAPLMGAIQQQCMSQAPTQQGASLLPARSRTGGNGVDHPQQPETHFTDPGT